MESSGRHLRLRLRDNRVIAATQEHRRILASIVLKQGRSANLLAFAQPDTHLHLFTMCSELLGNRFAQRIGSSIKQRLALPVGFERAWNEPLRDGWHGYRLLRYILQQNEHHGLSWDPLYEASNLPDLLGLRLRGAYTAVNVRRWLPRIQRSQLLVWLGVPSLEPASEPVELVPAAACAAAGILSLRGRTPEAVRARTAVVAVIGDRLRARESAELLGVSQRTIFTLRTRPVDGALVRAIRLQLDLMRQLDLGRPEGRIAF